jgi:GDP-4-dehydro-6-deoxy-D-mannose reductase
VAGTLLPFQTVFVTGGSGFVGRYLLNDLRSRLPTSARLVTPGCDGLAPLDLRDADAVHGAIAAARPELVFHLAAQSSVGQSADTAAETWSVNVGGTLNLARAIAASAPDTVVAFASSSEVYGSAFNNGPVDEDTALQPRSVYARTKRAAEELLSDTLAPSNRLRIFRPTNHSGPGQDTRFALPAFANQIAAIEGGERPPVIKVGSLTAERDFVDVRDVVMAYCDVLAELSNERVVTLNVASSRIVPVGLLLDRLLELTNVTVAVEQDPALMRPSDVPRTAIDAGRLHALTGWQPSHPLEETIADVLDWFRQRHVLKPVKSP